MLVIRKQTMKVPVRPACKEDDWDFVFETAVRKMIGILFLKPEPVPVLRIPGGHGAGTFSGDLADPVPTI